MADALKMLQEIDQLLELGQEGYAQTVEIDSAEKKLKDFLKTNIDENSLLWRKFDRWNSVTRYKPLYTSKYAVRSQLGILESLRVFLTEFIEENGIETPLHQIFIKPGSVYSGRRILREILSGASRTIHIQDNYVGTKLLDIFETCFSNNPTLQIKLLTKDGNYKDLKQFTLDLPVFQEQFSNLEVKSHNLAHGRFVVIDDEKAYSPGASLKDLGKKAELFSEILEDTAKREMISSFKTWWADGISGVHFR